MSAPAPPAPANDHHANAVRLVPLIGTLHVDEGRLERARVVQLIPTPAAWLGRHARRP